jgi:hypothetical protein
MVPFAEASVSGILTSGQVVTTIPPIPLSFWQRSKFQAVNAALASRPPVGGPNGVQPETPNDRIMESFGSEDYPYPFLPTDAAINGAKGKIMQRHVPTADNVIITLANNAVRDDTQADADALLSSIRIVSYYHTDAALIRTTATNLFYNLLGICGIRIYEQPCFRPPLERRQPADPSSVKLHPNRSGDPESCCVVGLVVSRLFQLGGHRCTNMGQRCHRTSCGSLCSGT